MLIDDLYRITEQRRDDEGWVVRLTLNAAHPIFAGHFPGRPILPGVCLVQMVTEVTGIVSGCPGALRLAAASRIKFISFIDPRGGESLIMRLTVRQGDGEGITVDAAVFTASPGQDAAAGQAAFTLSGSFRYSPPSC